MNTKTQTHTPGPWIVKLPHITTPGALGYLATVSRNPQAEADARIIAAAPDMLNALKHCVPSLIDGTEIYRVVKAAIAKATEGK